MIVEIRGNVVNFSTLFEDANGVPIIPASVNLRIVFVGGDYRQTVNYAMTGGTASGDPYTYNWDTAAAGARPGLVYWSTQASEDNPAAEDGEFELTANPANQSG